ncbi:MAG: hypothetical protein HY879_20615 [Deltaproteobacteria bacterium]|nr:hypothetical protein [Deltaproteobacteria bacterium]
MLCASMMMAGCSSNSSSSSGFGSGSGYSVNLTATQTNIPAGGQTTLIASVKDAQGNPVNDSTSGAVTFTSSLGATFPINTGIISGGVSTSTYTAPASGSATIPGVDQVTASYRGAFAYVSIFVFKP